MEGGTQSAGTWGRASLGLNAPESLGLVTPEQDSAPSPHLASLLGLNSQG